MYLSNALLMHTIRTRYVERYTQRVVQGALGYSCKKFNHNLRITLHVLSVSCFALLRGKITLRRRGIFKCTSLMCFVRLPFSPKATPGQ